MPENNEVPLYPPNGNPPRPPRLERVFRAMDPTTGFYLAQLRTGQLMMIAALNFMNQTAVLCDPETQEPPGITVPFTEFEIVARNENPKRT